MTREQMLENYANGIYTQEDEAKARALFELDLLELIREIQKEDRIELHKFQDELDFTNGLLHKFEGTK